MELGSADLFHSTDQVQGIPWNWAQLTYSTNQVQGIPWNWAQLTYSTDQLQGIPWNSAQLTYSVGHKSSTGCPTRHDGSKTTCNSCCFL